VLSNNTCKSGGRTLLLKCDPWGIREGLATFGGVGEVSEDLKFKRKGGEVQKIIDYDLV
jgi:hypothetical protein